MNETKTFSLFGNEFQYGLIQSLIYNKSFFIQIYDILDSSYFTNEICKWLYERILDFYSKYKFIPTTQDIRVIINEEKKEDIKAALTLYISTIEKSKNRQLNFINDRALQFCRAQKLKKTIHEVYDLINQENEGFSTENDFDEDKIRRMLNEALNAGITKNIGHEYLEELMDRLQSRKRKPVPTKWKPLNDIIGGGLSAGELALVIAATGIGKTHFLINFGAAAVEHGLNVVHYTFELSDIQIGKRYDSLFSDISIDDLENNKEKVAEKINEIKNKGGNLFIKEYPVQSVTVNALHSHLDKLISHGIIPNVIIVDYADLIKVSKRYDQKRFELEAIVQDLRSLAQQFHCPLITASQTNRCLKKDTIVETLSGKIKLYELNENDKILTHNGFKNVNKIYPIIKQPVYKITLKSGKEIIVSANHDFPTTCNKIKSISTGLSPGDKLLVKKL
jgi:replicative DNA helicase